MDTELSSVIPELYICKTSAFHYSGLHFDYIIIIVVNWMWVEDQKLNINSSGLNILIRYAQRVGSRFKGSFRPARSTTLYSSYTH